MVDIRAVPEDGEQQRLKWQNHWMRTGRIGVRVLSIALAVVLIVRIGALPALGLTSAALLERDSSPLCSMAMRNMAPGSSVGRTLRIRNPRDHPVRYRLVIITRGLLWRCDPGGNSLRYDLAWSPGANQHLEPGEMEAVTVTVQLPLAAGNQCQGDSGRIRVRVRLCPEDDRGGTIECRPMNIMGRDVVSLDSDDGLDGYICWEVSGPLNEILR